MNAAQIVPNRPRVTDGVGSFAAALEAAGLGARLLATEGIRRSATALERVLRAQGVDRLLLHYANYSYQPRGCPGWLVQGIERTPARLVTLFHEVYATGPPWRSSFWLSAMQRQLAARVIHRSHAVVTTLTLYRDLIRQLVPDREVHVLPVASAIGEPETTPAFRDRPARLVVFGGPGGRQRAYRQGGEALSQLCRRLSIEEVLDIGPAARGVPAQLGGASVRALGVLAPEGVSQALLTARVGLSLHPPAFLGKSSVHAAYCAHGVAPIVLSCLPEAPELSAGVHYWTPGLTPDVLADVANAARGWYSGHTLRLQAARYGELLGR